MEAAMFVKMLIPILNRIIGNAYESGWRDATQYHGRVANVGTLRKMAEYREEYVERIVAQETTV